MPKQQPQSKEQEPRHAASKKKVVLEPAGTDLREFQAKYGAAWKQVVDSPIFQAAAQFLRNRKTDTISLLSEEQVEKNGREYLADLRGFLQHENQLLSLHELTDFTIPFEEPEDYISPEQEAELDQMKSKFREETRKQRYAR